MHQRAPVCARERSAVRALITGISGFAGSFLAEHLLAQGDVEVWGVSLGSAENIDAFMTRIVYLAEDLSDPAVAARVLAAAAPERIYHLAAQAFVPVSWRDPWSTMANNIRAEVNLLQLLAEQQARARVLVIGSNEEYGRAAPADLPLTEDAPLRPDSPYGVSKIAQDYLGLQYFLSHNLHIVRVRPFNHIGPRQNDRFSASNFAKQIAAIEAGMHEPILYVGNLDAQRDFTDVRDMVRAYALALEQGLPGEVYNIGAGTPRRLRDVIDIYLSLSRVPIRVEPDPTRGRPSDTPISYCDAAKFRAQTGWQPAIPLETTLRDILEYWREKVNRELGREGDTGKV